MEKLVIDNISLVFGGIHALSDVSIEIKPNLITSIIGPNGAGKTSILNCISGFYHPSEGKITFGRHNLTHSSPHQIAKFGIARAFQNLELFKGLSVLDNLMLARHQKLNYNFLQALIYIGKTSNVEAENRESVEKIIDFMELESLRKSIVGTLSYGLQKRVEVARALTLGPKVLLLDEPMAGMNIEEKEDMVRFVLDIKNEKETAIVLVEHDLGVVMDISDQINVLDFGKVISAGTPAQVVNDPKVIEVYIGDE